MVSKKIPLDILAMEKLLEAADKQASLVSTVPLVKNFPTVYVKNSCLGFSWCLKGRLSSQKLGRERTTNFNLLRFNGKR